MPAGTYAGYAPAASSGMLRVIWQPVLVLSATLAVVFLAPASGSSKLWFVIPVVLGLPLVHAQTLQKILLGSDPPWFRRKKKWALLAAAMLVLIAADLSASWYTGNLRARLVELLRPGVFEPWQLRSLRQEWMTISASQLLLLGMALMFTSWAGWSPNGPYQRGWSIRAAWGVILALTLWRVRGLLNDVGTIYSA